MRIQPGDLVCLDDTVGLVLRVVDEDTTPPEVYVFCSNSGSIEKYYSDDLELL